ncbi:MAG: GH92 family glycosyl hydrolase [Bacteroides sp.]|nr:GH92 family glycosyl hydrolase [Bacteroides sp.]
MKQLWFIGISMLFLAVGCTLSDKTVSTALSYVDYVDPLIGSGGHGHVFVGATVPHGMVQLGPNNLSKGWDWCSGYHDSDSTIIGFAHTHLSGTGIADLGDILFMPVDGNKMIHTPSTSLKVTDYVSLFHKAEQQVRPGYYAVRLDRYDIQVELTTTERVGLHKYTYPTGSLPQVIIDLEESVQSLEARQGVLETSFRQINDTTITGYRRSDEWARDHKVYFTTVFSAPILNCMTDEEGNGLRALLTFDTATETLYAKTGISYVSEQSAQNNLYTELPGWDFETIAQHSNRQWNEALSVIDFRSDEETMKIFYTALYHTMIAPSLFADTDGHYRGADGKIHRAEGFTPYTVFSLWDTYRAVHPLYTLIDTRVEDYVNTLLTICEQQGELPVWHLVGNETHCMVGVHSIPVIADACLKGFSDIDPQRAYQAVSSFRTMDRDGLKEVREQGYIPADKVTWSVARGLEYAIDDYCIAQLARKLGKEEDYHLFMERSRNYRHYFDPAKGFMRGKLSDGSWRQEYDPSYSLHLEDDYVEGNGWQYTWLVSHDVEGLIGLFGSRERFLEKLDSLFLVSSELNEGASVDISGMIGQYAHGNEPSHHTLYLYAYAGEAHKTAERVREVYEKFYHAAPDGLIGNEDCGQISAWYIFSTLGFYPVNPADGTFVFGSPLADRATIRLNNGKELHIIAHHNSLTNKYIQSVRLNGKEHKPFYITYQDIMQGGTLEYQMGATPPETNTSLINP